MQSGFLRCSAGVLGTALGVETALVADADAVLVVVAGMGAGGGSRGGSGTVGRRALCSSGSR